MDPDLPGRYYPKLSDGVSNESGKEPASEEVFRRLYQYESREEGLSEVIRKEMKCSKETIPRLFPVLKWLPNYKMAYLLPDVMSGLTVAVMHIPQGMAYAALGGVPPIVGIYTALFPVLVYILMGTSPHISMGTFAVVCMMVGKTVSDLTEQERFLSDGQPVTAMEVTSAVCFAVGACQLLLGALKLGSLSVLLSKTLISGFTTGAAVHVLTSQVKSLLGIRVKRYSGPLKIIYTYGEVFTKLQESNYVSVLLSSCVILVLGVYNAFAKPFLLRKFKRNIPIPIELIIVVISTYVSSGFELHERHGLKIIDEVPTGLPVPSLPVLSLLPRVIVNSLIDAIVAIVVNLSMANTFAAKRGYRIDGNQEILASGSGNIFGSFFSCMPFAASLSRSLIQESVGGETQVTNVVSCTVLVFVLLFIAPFFGPLPYCVLASIIVVSLKGMFQQFGDFAQIMKLSKLDGFVWLSSFLSVVILDIDYGLGVGIFASIASLLYRSQQPRVAVLGRIPGTQIFKDRELYRKAVPHDSAFVFRVIGGLHFANADSLRRKIFREMLPGQTRSIFIVNSSGKPVRSVNLILDMSSVPYMDPSAVATLRKIASDLEDMNGIFLLCDLVPSVYDNLQRCHFFKHFPVTSVFPTIQHALEYFESQNVSNRIIRTIA